MLPPRTKRAVSYLSRSAGASSPCSLKQSENTVRYWTKHTVQVASFVPSLDLMMYSGKLCPWGPKENENTTQHGNPFLARAIQTYRIRLNELWEGARLKAGWDRVKGRRGEVGVRQVPNSHFSVLIRLSRRNLTV